MSSNWPPLAERLHQKIERLPWSGCWIWTGSVNNRGYGVIGDKFTTRLAHRVSFELHTGISADGKCVLHRCDIPACINPEHLWLGTLQDNARDAMRKGRLRSLFKSLAGRKQCKHGHSLESENSSYRFPNGNLQCRECRRVYWQKQAKSRRAKRKEELTA